MHATTAIFPGEPRHWPAGMFNPSGGGEVTLRMPGPSTAWRNQAIKWNKGALYVSMQSASSSCKPLIPF